MLMYSDVWRSLLPALRSVGRAVMPSDEVHPALRIVDHAVRAEWHPPGRRRDLLVLIHDLAEPQRERSHREGGCQERSADDQSNSHWSHWLLLPVCRCLPFPEGLGNTTTHLGGAAICR